MGTSDLTRAPQWWLGHSNIDIDIHTLMTAGVDLASSLLTDDTALHAFVGRLMDIENRLSAARLCTESSVFSASLLETTFERGWMPAELVHVVGQGADKAAAPMLVVLLGEHARRSHAFSRAPQEWIGQLRTLGVDPGAELAGLRTNRRVTPHAFWTTFLHLNATVRRLPTMETTGPPPSRWGEKSPSGRVRSDEKVLNKIRGLLAKAESSSFTGERESFSAKAQELMTRYAIDTAMVDARSTDPIDSRVSVRRFTVDNPYVDAKMRLFSSVARPNGVKTVHYRRFQLVAAVGMPVDIDLCELLYTSLLVQSAMELDAVGVDSSKRGRGFRRSFLFAYAQRVEERITEAFVRARTEAGEQYGTALVPVFAERDRAVTAMFDEMFPNLTSRKTGFSNRSGWHHGRVAADRADITGGREKIED
jgi:hypothetical protein